MSEAPQPSPFERAIRAKAREIEAHRNAIVLHEKAAALFRSLGKEARAKEAKERAARARVMLELAATEAEALGWPDPPGQPFAGSDSGQDGA